MPLGIIQARLHSERLPHKMLLPLDGKSLVAWGYHAARFVFGPQHVVVAIPAGDLAGPLGDELRSLGAPIYAHEGPDWDVLGRFYACAHQYRDDPAARIHRVTPDDFPIEPYREVFTLADLDAAQARVPAEDRKAREHIGHTLPVARSTAGHGIIEINTWDDYLMAQRQVGDA